MSAPDEDIDLYELLSVPRSASKAEIKKAYHKAALSSHPDKVPDDKRADADVKFKSISQAYEILGHDDTRAMYDQYGMAAFEKGPGGMRGPGGPGEVDLDNLDDMFAQMFGGAGAGSTFERRHASFGGGAGMGGPAQRRGGKGRSEVQQYEVTLEELFKGKTTKFASTKNLLCPTCEGKGGKEKAKAKTCDTCKGRGATTRMRPVGPGLVSPETVPCNTCSGRGTFYAEKDKCKKCKGARTVKQKKILELYIPRGSLQGEAIVLSGEADQDPDDDEPGDIIFELVEEEHKTFSRAGADLQAEIRISLSEALTGFNKVVLKHLDGRGISLDIRQPNARVLRPDEIIKIPGEGMPIKRSDARGDLYLTLKILFPDDAWLKDEAAVDRVRDVLPAPAPVTFKPGETPDLVDEVEAFEVVHDIQGFGADSDDPRGGAEWVDEDGEDAAQAQCAQQ